MGIEWVEAEMRYLELGDARLTERAKQMIASFSAQPAKSMPDACENWAATKGAYRLLENEKVEAAKIRGAHYQVTRERVQGHRRVLAIQDTTDLDYTGKEVAEALGPLSNQYTRGLRMHSVLAVSVAGVPLGLLDQFFWSRDPSTRQDQGPAEERHRAQGKPALAGGGARDGADRARGGRDHPDSRSGRGHLRLAGRGAAGTQPTADPHDPQPAGGT